MNYTRGSDLFPAIAPNKTGMLDVGDGHQIYWEECGNPKGVPVIFLHGGPGAGASSIHRRFFDPKYYRIVLMDQRGCGRSRPVASVHENTTQKLISDLEQVRRLLEIEHWYLFGGSWGSTLALAYGVAHPDRCLGFILRGIFLGQAYEAKWFLNSMGTFQPEAYRRFVEFLPEHERKNVLKSYIARLNNPDPDIHHPAAQAWAGYEEACATLMPYHGGGNPDPNANLCLSRLEAHYFQHDFFMSEGHILKNIEKITHLPCIIVQGRYDLVCPPVTAESVARVWPKSQYVVVSDAGHSALEHGIRTSLINATQAFKTLKPAST